MKKILFATTALVATASVAAADVSFSGYGRFGAFYGGAGAGVDGINGTADDVAAAGATSSRIRLQIDMTTEADNGLTFGARLRAQANNGGAPGFNAPRFWASTGGFTLGVGNILGAIEAMPGQYAASQSGGTGLSGLGFLDLVSSVNGFGTWDAYSSGGLGAAPNNGVEVMYSAGDFSGHLSYSKGARADLITPAAATTVPGQARIAGYVAYAFNGWTIAAGFNESDYAPEDFYTLTVGGTVGPVDLSLGWAHRQATGDDRITLRAGTDIGAATRVYGYITKSDNVVNPAGVGGARLTAVTFALVAAQVASDDMSFGLGVSHNLGGGASLEAGVVRDYNGNTAADLGVRFNF